MGLEERPAIAVILSLIGGVLILFGSIITFTMPMYGWMGYGMMDSFNHMNHMMGSFWNPFVPVSGLWLIGMVSGILVIIGAVMLNARPAEHGAWGTIILVFSVVSLLGMGGLLTGGILGIIGGALALGFKPADKDKGVER